MFYSDWGFKSNPFDTSPLPPNEVGEALLVGRSNAIKKIRNRIISGPKITAIEGMNGIGKTSIANVASYCAEKDSVEGNVPGLFIPCRKIFQIDSEKSPHDFRIEVLLDVVQTLIEKRSSIKPAPGMTRVSGGAALNRWLNSVDDFSIQAGLWGANVGFGRTQNSGSGFDKSGFEKAAIEWLKEIFPQPRDGGVICIIDNLELLRRSQNARDTVEELRDPLFSIPGVRWIMCGALGIIHGIASSPRLEGYLHAAIEVKDLPHVHAKDLFESRVMACKSKDSAKLPFGVADFYKIFELYRGNIRSVLSALDEFCHHVADDEYGDLDDVSPVVFSDWLEEQAHSAYSAVAREVDEKDLRTLAYACVFRDSFRQSDFQFFEFENPEAFMISVRNLEHVGVLRSVEINNDSHGVIIRVAPKGRLVASSRRLRRFSAELHKTFGSTSDDRKWYVKTPKWSGETDAD